MRVSLLVKAVLLTILLVYPSASGAQTVTPEDAQDFMGTWAIDVNTPGGAITLDLTVTEADGKVAAEIGGGDNPTSTISEITKNGSSLVMKYEADLGGAATPVTLTADADGDTLSLNFDVAGQVLPATGTRK